MALALREIRALRDNRAVPNEEPYLAELDLDDPTTLRDVLTRHVYAVADRARMHRDLAHTITLAVYDVYQGKGYGRPLFRWAIPARPVL